MGGVYLYPQSDILAALARNDDRAFDLPTAPQLSNLKAHFLRAMSSYSVTINNMTAHDTQSFFTPDEFFYEQTRLLSQTYNLAHTLLKRSNSSHLFIPIRSLQYLAIIEANVFWFVDSLAYATRGDEGGRLIRISWHPLIEANQRESLTQHMDCRAIFYGGDMHEIQTRLNNEFYQAMLQVDQRHRDTIKVSGGVSILPLRPTNIDA